MMNKAAYAARAAFFSITVLLGAYGSAPARDSQAPTADESTNGGEGQAGVVQPSPEVAGLCVPYWQNCGCTVLCGDPGSARHECRNYCPEPHEDPETVTCETVAGECPRR